MRQRHFTTLLCAVLGQTIAISASAELILDDFDDPVEVVSPKMEGIFASSGQVGDLNATRNIRIAASQTDVKGSLDADISRHSALTANVGGQMPTPNSSQPLFSYQFNYQISAADVSQNGMNNAIMFDFLSIDGDEGPLYLQFGLWDESHVNTIFLGRVTNLPISTGPFVAPVLFSEFTMRDGLPAMPDFSTVIRIDFSFFFLRPSVDIQWTAQLDSIRFGHIPETRSLMMALAGLAILQTRLLLFREGVKR